MAEHHGGASKRKGSAFERHVGSLLGLWWCNDPRAFARTSSSGARSVYGVEAGDVQLVKLLDPPLHRCPVSVECKKRKDWSYEDCFKTTEVGLVKFWRQCVEDAKCIDHIPMMVYAKNRMDPMLGITKYAFEEMYLREFNETKDGEVLGPFAKFHLNAHIGLPDLYIVVLKDFLRVVSPETMVSAWTGARTDRIGILYE